MDTAYPNEPPVNTSPPQPQIDPIPNPTTINPQPINPTSTPATFIPQPPSVKPKSSFLKIIILVVICLALGVLFGNYFNLSQLINSVISPQPKACTMDAKVCPDGTSVGRTGPNCDFAPCPTIQATPDPTANWKTYLNDDLRISFRYPQEWTISPIPVGQGIIIGDGGHNENQIQLAVNQSGFSQPSSNCSNVYFDEIPAIKCEVTQTSTSERGVAYQTPIISKTVTITTRILNNYLQFSVTAVSNSNKLIILNQILSTSKFLGVSLDTSKWKTYTNSTYGFSFKYPEIIQGAANPQIAEKTTSVSLVVPNTEGLFIKIEIIPNENVEAQYEKDKSLISTRRLSQLEEITINGYKGYKTTFPAGSIQAEFIYIIKGDYLFKIETEDTNIQKQILSTFKFLE